MTSVTHDRIPVFQTDKIKQIVCDAFDEARRSGVIMIFAYVIMLDHTHVITDSNRKIKDVLRFLNGVSAKRVLDYLKENHYESSLRKLRIQERSDKQKYSVYEHHPNAFEIYGEDTMMQKVNYIHMNPVRAGLMLLGGLKWKRPPETPAAFLRDNVRSGLLISGLFLSLFGEEDRGDDWAVGFADLYV